ncbi:MAG: DUF4149 domain-containing protein [Geothrix sp.]|uniref:DUF4149 domain-containing protein n=1 Tax=Geothrix sp. TaxID=1962974 RepID=UPI0017F7A640|nr:DUF4149 domain-containing protein [Geothrix sp.]NWJ41725.1 DUF4149 domain-containing protein [Geothrix sp.]WIL20295.1 MAG: DUF4149 domain-containing protein [Geothrix sp.]
MNPNTLRRLDQLSQILLLLWAGAALGFGIFSAPVFFRELPSRDVAGRIAGLIVGRLDWAAWVVFGLAGLSWVGRWVAEVKEDLIGPIRLWSGGLMVALLMCLASSFVVTPKVQAIRARINAPIESLAADSADRVAYDKAHGLSRNLFFLRIILAVGLAATVGLLPRSGRDQEPAA